MKKNEFLGHGLYKPQINFEDDLFNFLQQDKLDLDNLQLLMNLGFQKIKPILPKLLEWVQDGNWPVAIKLFSIFCFY